MSNSERAPPVRKCKRAGRPCDRSRPARLEPPRARDRAPSSLMHRTLDAYAAQISASSAQYWTHSNGRGRKTFRALEHIMP
jgi:hypothetical protein